MDYMEIIEPVDDGYQDFLEQAVELLPDYLEEENLEKICIEKVEKNNGIQHTGLVVRLKGDTASPNIYMEFYYTLYKQGKTMDEILKLVKKEHVLARERLKNEDILIDHKNFKDKIFIRLVNYEKNKRLLEKCPYIPFLDLAITFRYLVKKDDSGIASALLSQSEVENMGLDLEGLKELAFPNSRRLFAPSLLGSGELFGRAGYKKDNSKEDLYVLTNDSCINGATSMVYEDVLREVADSLDSSYYILPSSVNELMIVPFADESKEDYMLELVKDMNENMLPEIEFLSDNIYFYDSDDSRLRIVEASNA